MKHKRFVTALYYQANTVLISLATRSGYYRQTTIPINSPTAKRLFRVANRLEVAGWDAYPALTTLGWTLFEV